MRGEGNSAFVQRGELLGWDRAAEIVALRFVVLVSLQEGQLFSRLHALCDHPQFKASDHADHYSHNRGPLGRGMIWRTNNWSILRASTENCLS